MIWTLLLRLDGPMQAWGVQSRFEIRDTGTEPSRSGVVGLVCAALGIDRAEPIPEALQALRMGVRVDREGVVRRDYQTAMPPPTDGGSKRSLWNDGKTTVSQRYYLADANFLVGLEGTDRTFLDAVDTALRNPRWPLCLGRKAFPPASPVWLPKGLREGALESVLENAAWGDGSEAARTSRRQTIPPRLRTVIEVRGQRPEHAVILRRPDDPRSFLPRRFAMREVAVASVTNPFCSTVQGVRDEH